MSFIIRKKMDRLLTRGNEAVHDLRRPPYFRKGRVTARYGQHAQVVRSMNHAATMMSNVIDDIDVVNLNDKPTMSQGDALVSTRSG